VGFTGKLVGINHGPNALGFSVAPMGDVSGGLIHLPGVGVTPPSSQLVVPMDPVRVPMGFMPLWIP